MATVTERITDHLSDQASGSLDLTSTSSGEKEAKGRSGGCAELAMPATKALKTARKDEAMSSDSESSEDMSDGDGMTLELDLTSAFAKREGGSYNQEEYEKLNEKYQRLTKLMGKMKKAKPEEDPKESGKGKSAGKSAVRSRTELGRSGKPGPPLCDTAKRNTSAPAVTIEKRSRAGSSVRRSLSSRPGSRPNSIGSNGNRGRSATGVPNNNSLRWKARLLEVANGHRLRAQLGVEVTKQMVRLPLGAADCYQSALHGLRNLNLVGTDLTGPRKTGDLHLCRGRPLWPNLWATQG